MGGCQVAHGVGKAGDVEQAQGAEAVFVCPIGGIDADTRFYIFQPKQAESGEQGRIEQGFVFSIALQSPLLEQKTQVEGHEKKQLPAKEVEHIGHVGGDPGAFVDYRRKNKKAKKVDQPGSAQDAPTAAGKESLYGKGHQEEEQDVHGQNIEQGWQENEEWCK